ncbi:MAG: HK97 gp10 family phage protein [Thermoleophilia bacterium]|nr:HK97 gp10 family phage protein [Thermoleophilia bacterium]
MIAAKLVGGAGLAAKFRKLEGAAQTKVLETALVAGALLVQNEWKIRAPYRTGTYRRSIHIGGHTGLASDFKGDDLGPQQAGPQQARVIIGTNITDPPYPIFLERGTSRMTARPSAGPAFDAKKAAALQEVGDAMREQLEKLT